MTASFQYSSKMMSLQTFSKHTFLRCMVLRRLLSPITHFDALQVVAVFCGKFNDIISKKQIFTHIYINFYKSTSLPVLSLMFTERGGMLIINKNILYGVVVIFPFSQAYHHFCGVCTTFCYSPHIVCFPIKI